MCVFDVCVCLRRGAMRTLEAQWGPAVFIALPTTRPRVRGCVRCHRPVSRAFAAGASFTTRTFTAPWAARYEHTSVIDAAGAIYVIGGYDDTTRYKDVWVSTDGGARAGLAHVPRVLDGYSGGTAGVLQEYSGVLQGH
jgi:hypothetical protein